MKRAGWAAFTLIELLIVISIVAVLLAMMVPALGKVWQVVDLTRCQANLGVLYKAQGVWAADRSTSLGDDWSGTVMPYLDRRASALMCPATAAGGSSETDNLSGSGGDSPKNDDMEAGLALKDFTVGVTDQANHLLYEIPLSASAYWTMYQTWREADGRLHIGANIDAYMAQDPRTGRYTDEDFQFFVKYVNGTPSQLIIGNCDGNGNGYYTDMRINHKPIWGGERFLNLFAAGHVGEVIDLSKYGGASYSSSWTVWSGALGLLSNMNYGISRGCYQDKRGRNLKTPDPKLFFILDYPRSVVDLTDVDDTLAVNDKTNWSQVFISPTPPTNWTAPLELEDWSWQRVQALRHQGRANVLFCDGHVDSLGPEDLAVTNPLWRYQLK
jgi:prepilin-type processing-associated H-X9-DG protein/prepilin-type N-terminal cleavage/methylation domain-containing protein